MKRSNEVEGLFPTISVEGIGLVIRVNFSCECGKMICIN